MTGAELLHQTCVLDVKLFRDTLCHITRSSVHGYCFALDGTTKALLLFKEELISSRIHHCVSFSKLELFQKKRRAPVVPIIINRHRERVMPDHYATLGLSRGADENEIKKA